MALQSPFEDDPNDSKLPPSMAVLTGGVLARLQKGETGAETKRDWSGVPAPRPITDEKMQLLYATICHGFTATYKLERIEIPLLAIIGAAADSERDGWCYMSQATLAKLCGVSIPTIRDGIKRLDAKNLLERGPWIRGETVQIRLSPKARRERQNYKNTFERQRKNKRQV